MQFGHQRCVLKEAHNKQTNKQNMRFGVAKEETFLAFFDATTKRMDGQNPSTE